MRASGGWLKRGGKEEVERESRPHHRNIFAEETSLERNEMKEEKEEKERKREREKERKREREKERKSDGLMQSPDPRRGADKVVFTTIRRPVQEKNS